MTDDLRFQDILTAAAKGWRAGKGEDCLLSMALPLKGVDPLRQLPFISYSQSFRFLWDGAPGLCLAASGHCQSFHLVGPRRFELAQRFSDATFARLTDITPQVPSQARPRVLFTFSFFEQASERLSNQQGPASVESVLPRWQLSSQGRRSWLRLNGVATHEADARELAEELWLMRERLVKSVGLEQNHLTHSVSGASSTNQWENCYRPALIRGIDLVNSGELLKLVLAAR